MTGASGPQQIRRSCPRGTTNTRRLSTKERSLPARSCVDETGGQLVPNRPFGPLRRVLAIRAERCNPNARSRATSSLGRWCRGRPPPLPRRRYRRHEISNHRWPRFRLALATVSARIAFGSGYRADGFPRWPGRGPLRRAIELREGGFASPINDRASTHGPHPRQWPPCSGDLGSRHGASHRRTGVPLVALERRGTRWGGPRQSPPSCRPSSAAITPGAAWLATRTGGAPRGARPFTESANAIRPAIM
jgi:hypothetical protein